MVLRELFAVVIALFVVSTPAGARTIKLCLAEREFLPVSSPDFEAPGQYLARLAIEHQGDQATFTALPWRRCVAEVKSKLYDGAIGVVPTQTFLDDMRFPQAGDELDVSKSLGDMVFVALRSVSGNTVWDGRHFQHLSRPVLYNPAAQAIEDKLNKLGVTKDGSTPEEERMMSMLLVGRADIAIGREDAVLDLLDRAPFRDNIEILPRPFLDSPTYLAFRKDEDRTYVEAVWNEIAHLREASNWEDQARTLLNAAK
jgi:polar amino acid transport system substrate-binding protein